MNASRFSPTCPTRRRVLKAALLAGALPLLPRSACAAGREVLFTDYPFKLGVASGVPSADGFVLWTRLCPNPLIGGGMGIQQVPMRWEVADDEHFGKIVAKGDWWAMAGLGHSAHVSVTGLRPDRWYWYRFMAGNEVSPVGRTRTLPATNAAVDHLRFAVASCQHYELGYFSAYRHMLADNPDLVCFVGDYIYEYNASADRVRLHCNDEPYSLADYRTRYSQYHLDPDLQAMHAAVPWMMTIDDHEVMNDWAGGVGEGLDPSFPERRDAALQAYFEHVPLPMDALLKDRRLQLYRSLQAGTLARFHVLDDRQYRSPEACSRPGMGGSTTRATDATCPERLKPEREMLGNVQQQWFNGELSASKARWNFVVQETLVSPLATPTGHGREYFTDAWDGYPVARQRLIDAMRQPGVRNPVIVGGDYHCTLVGNVKADPERADSATVASEFVGTSITAPGMSMAQLTPKLAANPNMIYGESRYRGYLLFDVRQAGTDVAVRNMQSVDSHDAACITRRKFRVEDGQPGIIAA